MTRQFLVLFVVLGFVGMGCGAIERLISRPVAPGPDPQDVRIVGDKLTVDDKIYFVTDSAEIRPESEELLDRIARLLLNHAEIKVVHVVGHTDAQGEAEYNQELSDRRAQAVVAGLQARGVNQILDARGAGESELVCQEVTEDCHLQNRRVEFLIEQES